jgi:hypothetical protein
MFNDMLGNVHLKEIKADCSMPRTTRVRVKVIQCSRYLEGRRLDRLHDQVSLILPDGMTDGENDKHIALPATRNRGFCLELLNAPSTHHRTIVDHRTETIERLLSHRIHLASTVSYNMHNLARSFHHDETADTLPSADHHFAQNLRCNIHTANLALSDLSKSMADLTGSRLVLTNRFLDENQKARAS